MTECQKRFYNVEEVMAMLGVQRSKAYEIIRILNRELKDKGYIVIEGKVAKRYFDEKMYS